MEEEKDFKEQLNERLDPLAAPDTQELEIIKEDALIELKFSTGFYKRCQSLLYHLLASKDSKDILAANKQIQEKNITEDWVYHYETLLILCKEVEAQAREQKQMEKTTVGELKKKLGDLDA